MLLSNIDFVHYEKSFSRMRTEQGKFCKIFSENEDVLHVEKNKNFIRFRWWYIQFFHPN